MLTLSFALNVIVLALVLVAFAIDTPLIRRALGPDTPGRRMLACVWTLIALASATALAWPDKAIEVAHTLLPLQIGYKVLSWPLLGWANPATKVNLAMAALHAVTVASLYA